MPVQINEVIVRAVIDPLPKAAPAKEVDCPPPGNSGGDADIVEKVLEVIKEKQER